jgi:ketol-acid reductoisomerase
MKVYYDKDADLSLVKGKKVTIIGYGSQGHAHAQNLQDSGVKVTVALRKAAPRGTRRRRAASKVAEMAEAIKGADIVMVLLPDEHHAAVYKEFIEPNIKKGASLAFAHGFNIHYGLIQPRADLDVWMVAPKAPGHTVRSTYAGRRRRADADRGAPRTVEEGARPGAVLRRGDRRRQGRRHRDRTSRKRPRPTSSASRPCSAAAASSW